MFGKGSHGRLMVMKISLDGQFILIAPFVFGIQRCSCKLSFGTLMVMKISLNGQFFLVVPLTLECKDVFFWVNLHLAHPWS
jgi:hypothetical protein